MPSRPLWTPIEPVLAVQRIGHRRAPASRSHPRQSSLPAVDSDMVVSGRPGRLTVGIVGCGRVGSVLGAALGRAGHELSAVSAVSVVSRRRAAALLPGVPVRPIHEVVECATLVLLAVPDDALAHLVEGLAATETIRSGQMLVHTSGRHGLAVLDPAVRRGALPLALHPALTFTGSGVDEQRLAGITFGTTAPEALRAVAETLVLEMGGEPVWIPEQSRPLYHAALAIGANHLVTLVAEATDLLRRAGVEQPAALLGPLLGAALDGALRTGDAALTGPVARGDADTVAAHLQALSVSAPDSVPAYVAMARLTAGRALATGRLSATEAERLLDVLAADRVGR